MADVTGTFYEGESTVGYGTELLVGIDDGSPETFVAVADVSEITPGDISTAVVDKTHLRSPDAHREKVATIRDAGPIQIKGNWRPSHGSQSNAGNADGFTSSAGLLGLCAGREERNFIIRLPAPADLDWPVRGVITKFQPGTIGVNEKIEFTAEITPLRSYTAELP